MATASDEGDDDTDSVEGQIRSSHQTFHTS